MHPGPKYKCLIVDENTGAKVWERTNAAGEGGRYMVTKPTKELQLQVLFEPAEDVVKVTPVFRDELVGERPSRDGAAFGAPRGHHHARHYSRFQGNCRRPGRSTWQDASVATPTVKQLRNGATWEQWSKLRRCGAILETLS